MEFKIYPNFSEKEIVFITNLIDKKCNINLDTILTKKIMKIWYNNNKILYENKFKNNNKIKNTIKNIKLYNKLNDTFLNKISNPDDYNRRFYKKKQIILNNMTPEDYIVKNNLNLIKYNDIKYKLENDKDYKLYIIKNNK